MPHKGRCQSLIKTNKQKTDRQIRKKKKMLHKGRCKSLITNKQKKQTKKLQKEK